MTKQTKPPIRWGHLVLAGLVVTLSLTIIGSRVLTDYVVVVAGRPLPAWVTYLVGGIGAALGATLIMQTLAGRRRD